MTPVERDWRVQQAHDSLAQRQLPTGLVFRRIAIKPGVFSEVELIKILGRATTELQTTQNSSLRNERMWEAIRRAKA